MDSSTGFRWKDDVRARWGGWLGSIVRALVVCLGFGIVFGVVLGATCDSALAADRPLTLGKPVSDRIKATDPQIRSTSLDRDHTQSLVARGHTYVVKPTESGPAYFTLDSSSFAGHLVLRGPDVEVEDELGPLGVEPTLTVTLEAGREYRLFVAARMNGTGAYTVRSGSGTPDAGSRKRRLQQLRTLAAETSPDPLARALASHRLAVLLARGTESEVREARAFHLKSIELRKAELGEHPQTARSRMAYGRYLQQCGDLEAAIRTFTEAVAMLERIYGAEHPNVASCLLYRASAETYLGDGESAIDTCKRAVAIYENTLGVSHRETAVALLYLATAYQRLFRVSEGLEACERALVSYEATYGAQSTALESPLEMLGYLYDLQGRFRKALAAYERLRVIREEAYGSDHPVVARTLNALGQVHRSLGNLDTARRMLERSIEIHEQRLGPEAPQTLVGISDLALLLAQKGQGEEARRRLQHVLDVRVRVLGARAEPTLRAMNNLADLLRKLDRHAEAEALVRQALQYREESGERTDPETMRMVGNLAIILTESGRSTEALRLYERVFRANSETFGADHPNAIRDRLNLARVYTELGDFARARRFYEEALDSSTRQLGAENPITARALINLAMLLADEGDFARSLDLATRSVATSEGQLERLIWSLPEAERLSFAAKLRQRLQVYLGIARVSDTPEATRAAYEMLLRWKGRVSRSLLQSRDALDQQWSPEIASIVTKLESVQSRLSTELYAKQTGDLAARRTLLDSLREERARLERELARRTATETEATAFDVDEVRAALPEDAAIIDFFVHDSYRPGRTLGSDGRGERGELTEARLSAWVLTKATGSLRWLDLGPAEAMQSAVTKLLAELVERHRAVAPVDEGQETPLEAANRELRDLLWKPLADAVGDAELVLVSPDTFLGTLPFEILQAESGEYLLEKHAFVYLQDIVSLERIVQTEPSDEKRPRLLAIGGVDYRKRAGLAKAGTNDQQARGDADEPAANEAAAEETAAADRTAAADPASDADEPATRGSFRRVWTPLSATRLEATAIVDIHDEAFEPDAKSLILTRRDATEERLKDVLPRYDVVHLATHGFFQPQGLPSMWEEVREGGDLRAPRMRDAEARLTGMLPGLLSGLVLAGANRPAPPGRDDGLLTAEELSWLNLSGVDLVVLSACETGLGSQRGGEGMLGLRRALRQAGARTVISSLWSVDDEATSELMQGLYYLLWLEGTDLLEAFREARLEMLQQARMESGSSFGDPARWGAFVLDGDWRGRGFETK